jgi:RimJ/RimL family protein N-acetyltransferase
MRAVTAEPIRTSRLALLPLRAEHAGEMAAALAGGPTAEVAWVVGTPWPGQGIATEAAQALVAGLGQQSVPAVTARIHPDHQASAAVAAAAGLTPTNERHDGEIRWHLNR